jgi:hypothetical protein
VEGSAVALANILASMNILLENNDAEAFITQVDALTNGILGKHTPESLILIKVNSWFGSRWLRFLRQDAGGVGRLARQPFSSPICSLSNKVAAKIRGPKLPGDRGWAAASQKGE